MHRDDLVDERRRAQQRLRWHLHQLDPTLTVPPGALDRAVQLERVGRWLARREQTVQVRIARDLVGRCRSLDRAIARARTRTDDAARRTTAPALLELPGCGALTAAKLLCEIGPIDRFRTDAQLARHGGVAPLEASSGRTQRHRLDRGGNRQLNCALHRIAITQGTRSTRRRAPTSSANRPKARAAAKRSAASNDNSRASSSTPSKRAPP